MQTNSAGGGPRFDFPVPQEPRRSSGLTDELLRQGVASFLRHGLMALGAAFASLGWVAPDKFDSWAMAHYGEILGWLLMAIAQGWSWLQKQDVLNLLRAAIQMDPQRPDGSPTQVADVRRAVAVATARAPRRALVLLLCAVMVSQSACFFGGATATQKFARSNKELQVYLQEADRVINSLTDTNPPLLPIDTAIEITLTLRSLNQAQKELLLEAVKYLQVNEQGEEVLVIDQAGRLRLQDLTQSLFTVATKVINNPAIFKMTSADRIRLTTVLTALQPLVVQLQQLIGKFKTVKPQQEQLRLLVPAGTRTSLLDLIKGNDGLAAELSR